MAESRHPIIATVASMMIPAMCMLSGCHHKELNEDAGQNFFPIVTIEYDWAETETERPDGMANLFYSIDSPTDSYWRSDFRPTGGTVRIPSGFYDAVAFSNDTHDIVFSDIGSLNGFTFSTKETDTSGIPDDYLPFPPQKLFGQPDRMWATNKNNIDIRFEAESLTVRFAPRRITREYQVEMTGIGHLESALRYFAAISDLAPSIQASSLERTGVAATVGNFMQPFDDETISSTIVNFGPCPCSREQRLAVYMWLADGSRKVYTYDVSDQIRQAPDSMNVLIRVNGPDLPVITPGEGGGSGGGMDVGVDDWDFVDIEL